MEYVSEVLRRMGLSEYEAAFDEQGYDDIYYLQELDEEGLRKVAEQIKMKVGHGMKFADWFHDKAASALEDLRLWREEQRQTQMHA